MVETGFTSFEVILGTPYDQLDNRELAIAQATEKLTQAFSNGHIQSVDVYGEEADAQYGVGLNIEIPEDMVAEFDDAVGSICESVERLN